MIFKKTAMQGGAVLSNGQRVEFSAAGYYETEDESVISQLAPIYEEVAADDKPVESKPAPVAIAKAGVVSSLTIQPIAK